MSRLLRLRAAVTAALGLGTAVAGVLAAPAASAADLPTPTPSAYYVHANEWFSISGSGCTATPGGTDAGVGMTWSYSDGDGDGDGGLAAPDGTWRLKERLRADAPPGVYEFHAYCDDYVSDRDYPVVRIRLLAPGEQPPAGVSTPGATQVTAAPGQTLTPSKAATPGAKYDYKLTGYTPFETVTVVLHSTPRTLGTFTADANGVVTVPLTVPTDLSGDHNLVVTRADGSVVSYPVQIAAVAAARGPELAYTGSDVTVPLILGATLVLAGGGVLVATRRRPAKVAQS